MNNWKKFLGIVTLCLAFAFGVYGLASADWSGWFENTTPCNFHVDCTAFTGIQSGNFADPNINSVEYEGFCDYYNVDEEKICINDVYMINGNYISAYKILVTDENGKYVLADGPVAQMVPMAITTEDIYPYKGITTEEIYPYRGLD